MMEVRQSGSTHHKQVINSKRLQHVEAGKEGYQRLADWLVGRLTKD